MTDPTDPTAVPADQVSAVITDVAASLKSSLDNLQADIQGLLDTATPGDGGTPSVPSDGGDETPATVTVDVSALLAIRDQFADLSNVVDGLPTEGDVTPTPPIDTSVPTTPPVVDTGEIPSTDAPSEGTGTADGAPLDPDQNNAQDGPAVPAPEGDTGGQIAGEGSTPV